MPSDDQAPGLLEMMLDMMRTTESTQRILLELVNGLSARVEALEADHE